MNFSFNTKFFYIGWDLKNTYHMEEQFGLSVGNYYIGYYYGDGWCAGFLDENGCLP